MGSEWEGLTLEIQVEYLIKRRFIATKSGKNHRFEFMNGSR